MFPKLTSCILPWTDLPLHGTQAESEFTGLCSMRIADRIVSLRRRSRGKERKEVPLGSTGPPHPGLQTMATRSLGLNLLRTGMSPIVPFSLSTL